MVVDYNKSSKSINAGMVVVDVKEELGSGGGNGTSFLVVVKERREGASSSQFVISQSVCDI